MITAVRLKPFDRPRGNLIKNLVLSSGMSFKAGSYAFPGSWRIIEPDSPELIELKEIAGEQVDVRTFATVADIHKTISDEHEDKIQHGYASAKARIENEQAIPKPKPATEEAIKRVLALDEEEESTEEIEDPKPKRRRSAKKETNAATDE